MLFAQQADKDLDRTLKLLNKESVSYIKVSKAATISSCHFLDARELNEFTVSHIPKAIHVGYNEFDSSKVFSSIKNKRDTVVVYCSIGVRSEDIGEKLLSAGYANVYNLYGGIFEWKNQGNKIVDNKENATDSVHAYSKYWSKFLKSGVKVYGK